MIFGKAQRERLFYEFLEEKCENMIYWNHE